MRHGVAQGLISSCATALVCVVVASSTSCGQNNALPETGTVSRFVGDQSGTDVSSLMQVSAVENRRSHVPSATDGKAIASTDLTEKVIDETDMSYRMQVSAVEIRRSHMPTPTVSKVAASTDLNKKVSEPAIVASTSWLSPLTGSSRDMTVVLLAVQREAHSLADTAATGSVGGQVLAILVAVLAIVLVGILTYAVLVGLRSTTQSKPMGPDPRLPGSMPGTTNSPDPRHRSPLAPPLTQQPLPQQPPPRMHREYNATVRPQIAVAPELLPGGGFLVPRGMQRTITVPALPAVPDPLFNFAISGGWLPDNNNSICWGQYVSSKSDPMETQSSSPYDAFISMLSLQDGRELGTIVIGKPPGSQQTEVHIKYGSDKPSGVGFGFLRKSSDPLHQFVMEGVTPLKIAVNGQTNRTIKIFSEDVTGLHQRAFATCYVTGEGQAWYEVECYELCDMLLISLTIMGVDRLDASNVVKMNARSWL